MAEDSELRLRKQPARELSPAPVAPAVWKKVEVEGSVPKPKKKLTAKERAKAEDSSDSYWLDALRVIAGLVFAYCGLSYLITGGETFSMGNPVPAKYLQLDYFKSLFQKPLWLTPEELAAFDGSDPAKPVYLAINGSIYDVSVNRRTYGPGGSYQYFAGVDASRAFATGCFAEDRTADMRGVEEMFLPIEDREVDSHWTAEELSAMRRVEREEARKKVHDALQHWVDFFRKSKKYRYVGRVKREKGWLKKEKRRKLCGPAQEGRVKRKVPEGKKPKDKK